MEKVATKDQEDKNDYHVFEVELENLLGAQGPVKHPKVLARVIPDHICRRKIFVYRNPNNRSISSLPKLGPLIYVILKSRMVCLFD